MILSQLHVIIAHSILKTKAFVSAIEFAGIYTTPVTTLALH